MKKQINIGDRVSAINESVKAKVLSISGKEVLVEDEFGFERTYSLDELIIYDTDLDSIYVSKVVKKDVKKKARKQKKVAHHIIDLHNKNKYLPNTRILEYQLKVFVEHLNIGIAKKWPIMIFIHGEGEGVLRKNIELILKKNRIAYQDASYHEFGGGAVEVYLKSAKVVRIKG